MIVVVSLLAVSVSVSLGLVVSVVKRLRKLEQKHTLDNVSDYAVDVKAKLSRSIDNLQVANNALKSKLNEIEQEIAMIRKKARIK